MLVVANLLPRDRKFLSFDPRLALRSVPSWSPRASTDASSGLLNRQEPAAGRVCPDTTRPEPRPRAPPAPPRAHPAPAAAAEMGSGSGGERCHARWTARRPRLGLREVSQDRVHDVVVGDERDDPHLPTARRAHQRVDLVDTLDKPDLSPAKGAGIRKAILFVARPCGANPAAPHKGRRAAARRAITRNCPGGEGVSNLWLSVIVIAVLKGFSYAGSSTVTS